MLMINKRLLATNTPTLPPHTIQPYVIQEKDLILKNVYTYIYTYGHFHVIFVNLHIGRDFAKIGVPEIILSICLIYRVLYLIITLRTLLSKMSSKIFANRS